MEAGGEYNQIVYEKMSVAVKLDQVTTTTDHLIRLNRTIARRFHPDQPIWLGKGVSVAKGGFLDEGGSLHDPVINPISGTVVVVRDVDNDIASTWISREPHIYSAVTNNEERILDLQDERSRLKTRVKNINEELLNLYIAAEEKCHLEQREPIDTPEFGNFGYLDADKDAEEGPLPGAVWY